MSGWVVPVSLSSMIDFLLARVVAGSFGMPAIAHGALRRLAVGVKDPSHGELVGGFDNSFGSAGLSFFIRSGMPAATASSY